MKKNVPIIIVLIALFFAGWILVESGSYPFLNSGIEESESENVNEIPEEPIVTAPEGKCYVGGCSVQICSDQEGMVSTCEFRPEYSCYGGATCERQANGQCGWTQTRELTMCLNNAGL